ncbi:response regulator [Brevundimonas sp. TWP2-3-2]|uniref:response regulator n=1 Tax=unclassified Brevundimonas TaxID=2622653 RepID=UPI003CE7C84F
MKLAGKRILVVEDEPIVAMLVEDILLDEGAAIVGPAANVAQAMLLAATAEIDAGFLDVNLNGEDSHCIAAKLRERGIPFVYATGYGTSGEMNTETPVIQKPYLPTQVAEVLQRLMSGPEDLAG